MSYELMLRILDEIQALNTLLTTRNFSYTVMPAGKRASSHMAVNWAYPSWHWISASLPE